MRNQTPLAPTGLAFDVTVYIVLNDFGPLGRAYVETDEAQADEATIVENILSGQYSQPLRVVAFNTAEGWARDVTEDVARAALIKVKSERRQLRGPHRFWSGRSGWMCPSRPRVPRRGYMCRQSKRKRLPAGGRRAAFWWTWRSTVPPRGNGANRMAALCKRLAWLAGFQRTH